jgi:hypothetical protein
MTRLKSEPGIKALGIDAGVMREKLHHLATLRTRFRDRPLQHLRTDTAAAALRGDTNILNQATRSALRAQSRYNAKLQASDDRTIAIFRDHKLDVGSSFERFECLKVSRRQRIFDPLASTAERIVREHRHNDADVVAACGSDGDRSKHDALC